MANMFHYLRDVAGWIYRWPAPGSLMFPAAGGPLIGAPLPFYLGYREDYTLAMQIKVKCEQVVIANGVGNSSTADTSFLPAMSFLMGMGWYVDVTPGGSPTMAIGDATTTNRFVAALTSSAENQKGRSLLMCNPANTNAAGPVQLTNAAMRITFASNPTNALGRIRLWIAYWELPEDMPAVRTGP